VGLVVSGEEESDAKRTQSTVLGVRLFVVAHVLDEILDGYGFLVLVGVPRRAEAGLVD
jgi:hypothetical protein